MISIILSTYNNEKTIFHSIKSILYQSYQNFELIIINDFSSDKTKKIIHSFNDSRIVYLENDKNIGRTLSRNKGIKEAKGEFIAIIDGDDIAVPRRLEVKLNYLMNNPSIDLVASNIIFFTEDKVMGISNFKPRKLKKINFYLSPLQMPHSTWMARAKFFKNFYYDPRADLIEDQDLLLRAHHKCQYVLLEEPFVFYRIPIKISAKYKLKQVFVLFLSRIRHMRYHKLFYYFPIIFLVFIISSISYMFGLKTVKPLTNLNSKYQDLLNEITNKD